MEAVGKTGVLSGRAGILRVWARGSSGLTVTRCFDAAVGARLGAGGSLGVDGDRRGRRVGSVGVLCGLSGGRAWPAGVRAGDDDGVVAVRVRAWESLLARDR